MSYIQNKIYKFLIPVNQLFTERKDVAKSSIKLILQIFCNTMCIHTSNQCRIIYVSERDKKTAISYAYGAKEYFSLPVGVRITLPITYSDY